MNSLGWVGGLYLAIFPVIALIIALADRKA